MALSAPKWSTVLSDDFGRLCPSAATQVGLIAVYRLDSPAARRMFDAAPRVPAGAPTSGCRLQLTTRYATLTGLC